MFGRPRCREWTPLATQQLRLRSLIQIVGYNIRPPESCRSLCSFYYTLHRTTMSAPFYTSERLTSPNPKWKEIETEITQSMSSSNVVIRIWCHILQTKPLNDSEEKPPDTAIETFGVYFSGLRFIGANLSINFTSDCFKCNTMVFQMHGGYFCSYRSLKLEVIPPENEIDHSSLSSGSSGKTPSIKVKIDNKMNKLANSRSISPKIFSRKTDKEYSKSHSPVERGFKQSFPSIRTSNSLNINQARDRRKENEESKRKENVEVNLIYEHCPESLDVKEFYNCDSLSKNHSNDDLYGSKIDLSETAENYDLRNEADGTPKYRYMALAFLKSEIRPSYNANKLQSLHLLQYAIKKKQEAVQEIKERIYQKSALNKSDENLKWDMADCKLKIKNRSQKDLFAEVESKELDKLKNGKIKPEDKPMVSNGPRLALKLNDLLSFKAKPSPFQRAEHVRLTKQLEILRFKKIILSEERDAKLVNIRQLKEKYVKLCEENQDNGLILGSELMQGFHALSKKSEALKEDRLSAAALRELAARSHSTLAARRTELLGQLDDVFCIEKKDDVTWTICKVPLPICTDDSPRRNTQISEAVASGLAAQLTCLIADLCNLPLRYDILLMGSASRIIDLGSSLSDPKIPLFAKSGDTSLFRYALFLLNKCIVQLMYARGVHATDLRPTLFNLQRLMASQGHPSDTAKLFGIYKGQSELENRSQSLRSLVASERGKYRQFNRFKDSVDGQLPQTVMTLQKHRHTRSVGHYDINEHQELSSLQISSASIMGSEPSLSTPNTTHHNNILKSHNSDSEISRLSLEQAQTKVVFTLGDDDEQNTTDLVKLSINNGDSVSIDTNVKLICTEITNFCSPNGVEILDEDNHEICNDIKSANSLSNTILDSETKIVTEQIIHLDNHNENNISECSDIDQ